jgi:hypothetical protein
MNGTYGRLASTLGSVPAGQDPNWGAAYLPSHFGTFHYFLLPFIEQDNVYKSTEINGGGTHSANSWYSHAVIKVYQAPNDPTLPGDGTTWSGGGSNRGATSYLANFHAFGGGWDEDWQVGGKASIPRSFPDGTSNSIGFFEAYSVCGDPNLPTGSGYVEHIWGEDGQNSGPSAECCANSQGGNRNNPNVRFVPAWWAYFPGNGTSAFPGPGFPNHSQPPPGYPFNYIPLPQNNPPKRLCNPRLLQTLSAGGIQVMLMDGSVRVVSPSISQFTWAAAIVPDDGQVLGNDW